MRGLSAMYLGGQVRGRGERKDMWEDYWLCNWRNKKTGERVVDYVVGGVREHSPPGVYSTPSTVCILHRIFSPQRVYPTVCILDHVYAPQYVSLNMSFLCLHLTMYISLSCVFSSMCMFRRLVACGVSHRQASAAW